MLIEVFFEILGRIMVLYQVYAWLIPRYKKAKKHLTDKFMLKS